MIDIKQKNDTIRLSVEVTDKCVYSNTLMGEEYVLLSFVSDVLVRFVKGDYIDTDWGRFKIVDIDKPQRTSSGGWLYEQKFHSNWWGWKNRLVFYDRQKGSEKSWKMTQKPEYFLDIIIGNIAEAGFGEYTASIDSSLVDMKLVEFDGTNIIEALNKIAEAWETEWWVTDNTIHLSRCEFGSPVTLKVGDALSDMERNDGQDTDYITRLYAFGSTRNLSKNYRKDDDSDVVVEGIVEKRLKLPEGTPYVDAWEDMADEDIVEGVVIFDEVYPRRVGTLTTVTTKEYTETVENEDGTTTENKWNAFRFTDAGLTFSKDYMIDGEELRLIFQTGKLAGMDFALTFNPDNKDESSPEGQVFEIVRNEDYGIALPSDDFAPEVGDTYILYGYDTSFVAGSMEDAAEQELLDKARKKVAKTSEDKSVYDCSTNPIRCAGYTEDGNGELIHDINKEIDLAIGQAVTLEDENLFADSTRTTRVYSFEKRLDNKYNASYVCGDTSEYSNTAALNEQVEELTYKANQFVSQSNSSVYVIKRYDSTTPSDFNVLSALRSLATFFRKDQADITEFLATFKKGAHFGKFFKSLYAGTGAGIDADGNAEFESVRVRSYFEAMEYIVNRLGAIEGDQLLTEADTIDSVDDLGDNCYRLNLHSKWEGYFTAQIANNVLKGIINTLASGSGVYYTCWMRVNSVNAANNSIEVTLYPDDETPAGKNYPPCELMRFARWGNQTDTTRQDCIYLSTTEGRIVKLRGVTKPIIDSSNYGFTIGVPPEFLKDLNLPTVEGRDYVYTAGIITQDIIRIDWQGKPIVEYVDRDQWTEDGLYYCDALNPDTGKYETSDVWYHGCKYRCTKNLTETAPAWNNTDWAMIEGNPDFTVEFNDTDVLFDPDRFNLTLYIIAKLYNMDITEDILDGDVEWTRQSYDADGNERVASDNAWALRRAGSGKTITLTTEDCDFDSAGVSLLRFKATVTLRDGMGNEAAQDYAIFEY